MSRGIYVPLREEAREALIDLADREYRDPRTQAMKMITEALRQAGALPADPQPSNDPREPIGPA
jgi:hypothetical protein